MGRGDPLRRSNVEYRRTRGRWRRTAADPYVDERAVAAARGGRHVALTQQERAVVIARLTAARLPAVVIAQILGCTPRTVTRYRSAQRGTE